MNFGVENLFDFQLQIIKAIVSDYCLIRQCIVRQVTGTGRGFPYINYAYRSSFNSVSKLYYSGTVLLCIRYILNHFKTYKYGLLQESRRAADTLTYSSGLLIIAASCDSITMFSLLKTYPMSPSVIGLLEEGCSVICQ